MAKFWCSGCFAKTEHLVTDSNRWLPIRTEYKCDRCGSRTFECRAPGCTNMALGAPKEQRESSWIKFGKAWDEEFCAEHNGTIPSFERGNMHLDDLEDYRQIFEPGATNYSKIASIAGGAVGGVAVFGPLAMVGAPAIASSLGAAGMLGAASTGTAIATLKGAALASASLAAIGGGTMAAGTVFLTAAGAAMGGYQAAAVSNAYLGTIQNFDIIKIREGRGPAVIFVNGFLCENDPDTREWRNGLAQHYPNNPLYYVQWESSNLKAMGDLVCGAVGKAAAQSAATNLARRASKKLINPLAWGSLITGVAGNPWHVAVNKAAKTGILLADLLVRTKHRSGFILMGHSLGARVIYYALAALSTRQKPVVRDVYLLGGAANDDAENWRKATGAVSGKIYNCYSRNDDVLKHLYRTACFFQSSPIGMDPIRARHSKIVDMDVSSLVTGHMMYRTALPAIVHMSRAGRRPKPVNVDVVCPYCKADVVVKAIPGVSEDYVCGNCNEQFSFVEPVA